MGRIDKNLIEPTGRTS